MERLILYAERRWDSFHWSVRRTAESWRIPLAIDPTRMDIMDLLVVIYLKKNFKEANLKDRYVILLKKAR